MLTETEMKIPTPDGKNIHGILRGDTKHPLVIFVHGLTGNMNEAMFYEASRQFETFGYSSFRFNLYGPNRDARKLRDCTLKTHGEDITLVIQKMRELFGVSQCLFIAGHSYGFPSAIHADLSEIDRIASWDGTLVPNTFAENALLSENPKGRILDVGYEIIIGEEMVQESFTADIRPFLKSTKIPILFAGSGKSRQGHKETAEEMSRLVRFSKAITIPGARHGYTEEGALESLCHKTIEWFNEP